jgi:hypothetical protein
MPFTQAIYTKARQRRRRPSRRRSPFIVQTGTALAEENPKLTPVTMLLVMTKLYPDDNVWEARVHQSSGQGLVITGSVVPRANVGVAQAESRSGRTMKWCWRRKGASYAVEHLWIFPV